MAHETFAHAGGSAADDDDLDAAAVEFGDLFYDGAEASEGGVAGGGGYSGCAGFEEEAAG